MSTFNVNAKPTNHSGIISQVPRRVCTRISPLFLPIALSASALLGCSNHPARSAAAATVATHSSASAPSLRAFEEKTLENGLRILYVPDAALPSFSLSLLIESGSDRDPDKESGVTEMVTELLDKGTTKRKAPEIAQDLAQMGADFQANTGNDFVHLNIDGLSMKADKIIDNFSEIVLQPSFSDVEIERMRKQMLARISRRVDNAENFVGIAFDDYVYGSHPYGPPISGTSETLKSIKKKNIIQQYLRFYRPNNAIMSVVGSYTPEQRAKIETAFGAWQKREIPPMQFPKVAQPTGVQIRVVDKPGSVQAQIKMGSIGIKRQDPDFIALRIANTILGGAFSSRLGDRVRIKLGLTYSISSSFDARQDFGPFEISTFTKNTSVAQTISESLGVLGEFRAKGVSEEELSSTKGYLKGIFPAAIETSEKFALNLMLLRLYGVPDSYLTSYLSEVDKVSVKSLNQIIKQHFDEKNIKILVYSSATDVLPQLKTLNSNVEVKKFSEYF